MLYLQVTLIFFRCFVRCKRWYSNFMIELNKALNLCDIWRIRNPKKCKYTITWNYSTKIRLHFYITKFQYVKKYYNFNALLTDHSPVFCSLSKENELNKDKGKGLWSLITP